MNTTTRFVRKNFAGDTLSHDYASITLPGVPGVVIDGDRSDTAPRTKIIKGQKMAARGIALVASARNRVEMFRAALIEVAQEGYGND